MTSDTEPAGQHEPAPNAQHDASGKPDGLDNQIPSTATKPQVSPTKTECHGPQCKQKHWIDYVAVVLELVGLIVLCIYAAYTIKIYRANKIAADAARDAVCVASRTLAETVRSNRNQEAANTRSLNATVENFRRDQRAWVGTSTARITECGLPHASCRAEIDLINSGKTPALKLRRATGFLVSDGLISGPRRDDIKMIEDRLNSSKGRQALAPGGSTHLETSDSDSYVMQSWPAIQAKRRYLLIFGRMEYSDIYGFQRSTVFCFYMVDPTSKLLASCEHYNSME